MITFGWGRRSRIGRAASMPVERGMRASMPTTSGVISSARCTASMPSAASPTTLMSGSSDRTRSRPRRNNAWSSTITTRIDSPSVMVLPARASPDRLYQAEIAVPASVDDGGVTVLRVGEQEEVVPEQVHLEGSLLGDHRLHRELLGLHDAVDEALLLIVCVGRAVIRETGVETGCNTVATPGVRPRDALLLDARDLVLDLVDDEVERSRGLRGGRVGLHEVPLQVNDH